ncbi:hypothetical protein RYX36_005552 [Vicia faba]
MPLEEFVEVIDLICTRPLFKPDELKENNKYNYDIDFLIPSVLTIFRLKRVAEKEKKR